MDFIGNTSEFDAAFGWPKAQFDAPGEICLFTSKD